MFPEAAGDWAVDDVGGHLVAVAFTVSVEVGAFGALYFGFAGEVAEDGTDVSHSYSPLYSDYLRAISACKSFISRLHQRME